MMNEWFECKVRYEKTLENGLVKKVTEPYLVDALSFTEADRWFKAKVAFITLDEKSGAEKKSNQNMLIQASDLRDAVKRLDKGMEGTMADYEIASIAETPIMDVFHYKAEADEKPEFPEA